MSYNQTVMQAGDPAGISRASDPNPSSSSRRPAPVSSFNKRIGRPGSKRYQRFVNKVFLIQNEDELEEEDLKVFIAPTFTAFDELLYDDDKMELWKPFLDVTEERERKLLHTLSADSKPSRRHHRPSQSPIYAFSKIDSKLKKMLLRVNDDFLQRSDKEICAFVQNIEIGSVTYSFNDGYDRMICRGICQFYGLSTFDKDLQNVRALAVRRTPRTAIPGITLVEFISRNSS